MRNVTTSVEAVGCLNVVSLLALPPSQNTTKVSANICYVSPQIQNLRVLEVVAVASTSASLITVL